MPRDSACLTDNGTGAQKQIVHGATTRNVIILRL